MNPLLSRLLLSPALLVCIFCFEPACANAQITASTATLAFPSTTIATQSTTQTVIFTNTGSQTLHLLSYGFSKASSGLQGGFSLGGNCGLSLPAGQSCTDVFAFAPLSVGSFSSTFSAVTDAPSGATVSIALSGLGTPNVLPLEFSPSPTLVFPATVVGSSDPSITTLVTNPNPVAMTLSQVSLFGPNANEFNVTASGCQASIPAGSTCSFTVAFHPGAPGLRTATLRYVAASNPNGAIVLTGAGLARPILPVVADLNHITTGGQSLEVGTDAKPIASTSETDGNMMLNQTYGVNQGGAAATGLAILQEINVESSAHGFADRLARRAKATGLSYSSIVSSTASAGEPYAALAGPSGYPADPVNGSPDFQTMMANIRSAKMFAAAQGKSYRHTAIGVNWGQADAFDNPACRFDLWMPQYQADIQAGSHAITGDTGTIPMFLDQTTNPQCGLSMYLAAVNHPDTITLLEPEMIYEHVPQGSESTLHLTAFGQRLKGEYRALAVEQVVLHGRARLPFTPVSVTVSGNVVTLDYTGRAVGQLVLDESLVKGADNYGFLYRTLDNVYGAGGIIKVVVVGQSTVQVTLSKPPTGTGLLTAGYEALYNLTTPNGVSDFGPASGLGLALRDSNPDVSVYPDRNGALTHMYHYANCWSAPL